MKKKTKKYIFPIIGAASIFTAPWALVSGTGSNENQSNSDEFTVESAFNDYITLIKSGSQNNTDLFLDFSDDDGHSPYQYVGKPVANRTVFWWNNVYTDDITAIGQQYQPNFFTVYPESIQPLINQYWGNAVLVQDITEYKNGETPSNYDISGKNRRWRITFNNGLYAKPSWNGVPNMNNSSDYIQSDVYGNVRFGILLTRDLQIVDNSLSVSVLYHGANRQPYQTNGFNGITYNFETQGSPVKPSFPTEINVPNVNNVKYDTYTTYKVGTQLQQGNKYTIPASGFTNWWNYNSISPTIPLWNSVMWNANALNGFYYLTTDNNNNPLSSIEESLYSRAASSNGYYPQTNPQFLQFDFIKDVINAKGADSALNQNLNNLGSLLAGSVAMGGQWNVNNPQQPAIVVEFETTDNQYLFTDKNNQNSYSFMQNNAPSGVTGILSLYRGTHFVASQNWTDIIATHSISQNRTNHRTIKLNIVEEAVPSYASNSRNIKNSYLPNNYGYQLYWKDTLIASVSKEEVQQAKGKTYDDRATSYDIDLIFNTDISKWPAEIKTYNDLMNSSNLKLVRTYDDPQTSQFFKNQVGYTSSLTTGPDSWINNNVGGIYLDQNSLRLESKIKFIVADQWSYDNQSSSPQLNVGLEKLASLNDVSLNTSNHSAIAASSNSIYKSQGSYNFDNQQLNQEQIEAIRNAIFNDWTVSNYTETRWKTFINDLKQTNYDVNIWAPLINGAGFWNTQLTQTNSNYQFKLNTYNTNNNQDLTFELNQWLDGASGQSLPLSFETYMMFGDPNQRKALATAILDLQQWKTLEVPKFTSTNPITNSVQSSEKGKQLVDNVVALFNQMKAYKGQGYAEGSTLTTDEFIKQGLTQIDNLKNFTASGKTQLKDYFFKNITNSIASGEQFREPWIKYINTLTQIDQALTNTYGVINKYQPVITNSQYNNLWDDMSNANNLSQGTPWNKFATDLDGLNNLIKTRNGLVNQVAQNVPAVPNQSNLYTQTSLDEFLTKLNELTPIIATDYAGLNADIKRAIAQVEGFTAVSNEQKAVVIKALNNILTSTNPDYKLLENYQPRELKIQITLLLIKYSEFLNTTAQTKTSLNDTYRYQSPIAQTPYTNSITQVETRATKNIDGVQVYLPNGSHPDLISKTLEGIEYYIIPNTTIDSASVNYYWQDAARNKNQPYPTATTQFVKTADWTPFKAKDKLLEDFTKALEQNITSIADANNLLETWKTKATNTADDLDKLKEMSDKFAETSKANSGLNAAQIDYYAALIYSIDTTATENNRTNELNNAFTEATNLKAKMQELQQLFNEYFVPTVQDANNQNPFVVDYKYTPNTYVFGNGQIYGLGNFDKAEQWNNNTEPAQLSSPAQTLLAFLVTAKDILQISLPNTANGFSDTTKQPANLPAALQLMTPSQAAVYNEYFYDATKVTDVIDSIKQLVTQLNGRYQAVNDYPLYVLENYGSVLPDGTAFFTKEQAQEYIQSLVTSGELNPQSFNFENEADTKFYTKINQEFIIPKLQAFVNENFKDVSDAEKTAAFTFLKNESDSINFYSLVKINPNKPNWLQRVRGVAYELEQINLYRQGLIDDLSNSATNPLTYLTTAQKQALKDETLNTNLFTDTTISDFSKPENELPPIFNKDIRTLHLTTLNNFASNAQKLNEADQKLRELLTKCNALNVNQPNEDTLLKLATNRAEFLAAYNAVSGANVENFANINPEAVTQLVKTLQTEYDKLNGYKVQLEQEISQIDPAIKTALGEEAFNKATDVSKVPATINATEKQTAYNDVLSKLKAAAVNSINQMDSLNPAQKQALINEINSKDVTQFHDLAPILQKAKTLNESMSKLKADLNNANTFVKNNTDSYNELPNDNPAKQAYEQALKQAQATAPAQAGAQGVNADNQTVTNQTQALADALQNLKNELLKQAIQKELAKITTQDPQALQDLKTQTNEWLKSPHNETELQNKLEEIKHALLNKPLYEKIAEANKQNPINPDLQQAIAAANQSLLNNNTEAAVNQAVQDLQNAINRNELQNSVAEVNKITNPSSQLQNAITEANNALTNNDTQNYLVAKEKLDNAIKKEKLANLINQANAIPNGEHNDALQQAIQNAQNIYNNMQATPEEIAKAEKDLQKTIEDAETLNANKEKLDKLINEAKAKNAPWMNDLINNASTVASDVKASNDSVVEQINKLETALKLNELKQRAEQIKQANPNASTALNNELQNVNNLINKVQNKLAENPFTQDDANNLQNEIANQTNALNKANNLEPVYQAMDKINAIPKDQPEALQEQYNQMKAQAEKILNQISAATPDTDPITQEHANAVKQAASNIDLAGGIFHLAQAVNSADKITDKTPKLQTAYNDAKKILDAIGDQSQLSPEEVANKLKEVQPSLETSSLQNTALTPNELVNQATENLRNDEVREPLAKKIAQANEVMQLLNSGSIVIPDNLKDTEMTISDRKNELQKAIDAANDIMNETPVKDQPYYQNAADQLDEQIQVAEKLISQIKDALKAEIAKAKTVTPMQDYLSNAIKEAEEMLADPNAKAINLVKEITKLRDLEAKNDLQNAMANIPDALKQNQTFVNDILNPITTTLNNPNSHRADYVAAQEKLAQALKKEKLYEAYDNALKQNPQRPELQNVIKQAQAMLRDPNGNYKDEPEATFNKVAEELNKQIALNELNNAKNQAEAITNPSQELLDKIAAANQTLANPDQKTQAQIEEQTKDLLNGIDRNTLAKALEEANKLLPTFGDPKNPDHTHAKELADAIAAANALNDNHELTKADYDKAAQALQNVLDKLNDELNKQKDALKEILEKAQAMPDKSNALKDAIKTAEALGDNPSYQDVLKNINVLQHNMNTNALNNAIEQAPELTNPVSGFTPATNDSQTVANNPEATQEQIDAQTQKQLLSNAKVNALNDLDKLNSLNNAQKEALQQAIINAKDVNAITPIIAQANALNSAMQQAQDYINKLDPNYLSNPISNINYVYADPDKQETFKKLLDTVNNVLNKATGPVYETNQADQINQLLNNLKAAEEALNGKDKYQDILTDADNQLKDFENFKNSNSFYNSTKALQDEYNKTLKEALEQQKIVSDQETATDASATDKLQELLNKLKDLKDEISKFSDQEFTSDGKKVHKIDHILNEMKDISDKYKEEIKAAWNNAKTKEEADKVLQNYKEQITNATNAANDVNEKVKELLDSNPSNYSQNEIESLQNKIKDLINQGVDQTKLQDASNILNNLDNLKDATLDMDKFLNSDAQDKPEYDKVVTELNNSIDKLKDLTATDSNNPLVTQYNDKVNQLKNNARALQDIVNALLNNDETAFNNAINQVENLGPIYKELQEELKNSNYFNIVNKSKEDYSWEDVKAMKKLTSSKVYKNLSKVFQSAMNTDRMPLDRLPWYWWLVLAILGTSAGLTIYGLVKTNKKPKNK
ncbi:hypothetical protein [Mycoplasma hafezii]|uniref:hypothetical protein n=1 Tax=Mycoplasma hafezii TaxID=525886 RepID=UPI003CEC1AE5